MFRPGANTESPCRKEARTATFQAAAAESDDAADIFRSFKKSKGKLTEMPENINFLQLYVDSGEFVDLSHLRVNIKTNRRVFGLDFKTQCSTEL